MIPVDEGNEDCFKCDEFDMCNGCFYSLYNNPHKAPKCRRDVIISADEYDKYLELKEEKRGKNNGFWKSIIRGKKRK